MTRIFLLRHGETDWNANGTLQGSTDIPLNARGLEQAEAAAAALAPRLGGEARIIASPLSRARATAEALARVIGAEVHLDERLVERHYGVWEGMSHGEIDEGFPEERARWHRGEEPLVDGYEGHDSVAERMGACLREHSAGAPGGSIVFVSHGSALRVGIGVLLGLPAGSVGIGGIPNAHWSELKQREHGAWTLLAHAVGAPSHTA